MYKKDEGEKKMKKSYKSPKAEKMEFNYFEAVVASSTKCENETHYTQSNDEGEYCTSNPTYHVVRDVI